MKRHSFLTGLFLGLVIGVSAMLLLRSAQPELAARPAAKPAPAQMGASSEVSTPHGKLRLIMPANPGSADSEVELVEEPELFVPKARSSGMPNAAPTSPVPSASDLPFNAWGEDSINGMKFYYIPIADAR